MHEADLLLHLQAQGLKNVFSLPWTEYQKTDYEVNKQSKQWQEQAAEHGHQHPLLDIACEADIAQAGALLKVLSQKRNRVNCRLQQRGTSLFKPTA